MPRKEIETEGAALFGSEAMTRILRSLLEKEGGWIQQAELARRADVDETTVQRLLDRVRRVAPKSLRVDKPFKNVKIYRINAGSNLSKGLKLIFQELEK